MKLLLIWHIPAALKEDVHFIKTTRCDVPRQLTHFGFETAVSYTREFKNLQKDVFKAILWSGLLHIHCHTATPPQANHFSRRMTE
jgi:hypothetical protein